MVTTTAGQIVDTDNYGFTILVIGYLDSLLARNAQFIHIHRLLRVIAQ